MHTASSLACVAAAASIGIGLRDPAAADHWLAAAGVLFAPGRSPPAGATAAPAGNLYGTRGGRLIGLELDGLVFGGLIATMLIEGAPCPMGPLGTPRVGCSSAQRGRARAQSALGSPPTPRARLPHCQRAQISAEIGAGQPFLIGGRKSSMLPLPACGWIRSTCFWKRAFS